MPKKKYKLVEPKPMTAADKAAIKKIIKHCEEMGELLDSLSPEAATNILKIEENKTISIFEIEVYVTLLDALSE